MILAFEAIRATNRTHIFIELFLHFYSTVYINSCIAYRDKHKQQAKNQDVFNYRVEIVVKNHNFFFYNSQYFSKLTPKNKLTYIRYLCTQPHIEANI